MNSHFLIEKLENSEEYKKFKKENPTAYLCSGFFVVDFSEKNPQNKYHFDLFVPSSKKTFSFELEDEIKLIELERTDRKAMEKVSMKSHFDFDEIKEKIITEMESRNIKNKIQKMIFSLQSKDKKDFLLGTIFISGLGLLKADFDISEDKITNFEKMSLFDMMKIVKGKK